jgi:hypothetical protein
VIELSSLDQFHFDSLSCLLIIVRLGPMFMLAWVGTFGETDEKLATELNVALHLKPELGKAKLDREKTEVLEQEWSCNNAC